MSARLKLKKIHNLLNGALKLARQDETDLLMLKRKMSSEEFYLKSEADKVIDELKQKLEDVQASMYADVVDANMENRRLKRALWLSRALRARDKAFEYHFKNNVEMCAKWDNVHLMLMAKAEEYK